MAHRESAEQALLRWEMLELVQAAYPTFEPFLEDVMTELGFSTTEIQKDIAEFLEHGPHYLMIQAQRGQAKTTIVAAFAVWCLIHDPRLRVLILSAGGTQANEISTLVVRIIGTMDVLECLRPDRNAGDRTSVEAFDVHHSLKGLDKSPSVACVGITGNLQGKRADLLIADDIESQKNALTEHQRQALLNLTRDFPSICSTGRIIYLGTPQSINSIYNTLPGRGYTVRIWTGRYPTQTQLENYGGMLAPFLVRRLNANPELGYLHTWLPILRGEYAAVNNGDGPNGCAMEEVFETGQKELRIIDTLEPVIARGALIFNDDIARRENASLAGYSLEKRNTYSLFHQIAYITRDKQSLQHDDRLDALAGAVRYWVKLLGVDQQKAIEAQRAAEFESWRKNPLGRPVAPPKRGNLMTKYKR